jgi:hypothetical protein
MIPSAFVIGAPTAEADVMAGEGRPSTSCFDVAGTSRGCPAFAGHDGGVPLDCLLAATSGTQVSDPICSQEASHVLQCFIAIADEVRHGA